MVGDCIYLLTINLTDALVVLMNSFARNTLNKSLHNICRLLQLKHWGMG